jgi:hypothetical protein
MSTWIAGLSAGSVVLLAILTPLVSLNRFMISLGKEERELDRLVKFSLMKQNSAAFKLVIAGGAVAGLLVVVCVVMILWVPSATAADKTFTALCTIGDSALFRYYLQVWRESGKALRGGDGGAG